MQKIENPMQKNRLREIDLTPSEWFFLEYLLKDNNNQEHIICELCSQLEVFSTNKTEYLKSIVQNI